MKLAFTSIFTLLIAGICWCQIPVPVESQYFNVDEDLGMILVNKDINLLNSSPEIKVEIEAQGESFVFNTPISEFELGERYLVSSDQGEVYALYITELPIIHIITKDSIPDEPRVLAHFTLYESNGTVVDNKLGIELRGKSTSFFPKQSYRLEFWEDDEGIKKVDYSLLGMRNDDDWNLDAMYNQPLRMRNKLNFDIWRDIDELHYKNLKPKAINGVHQEYVELFLDDEYQGVYTLGERVDPKQLQLDEETDSGINGELYKGVNHGIPTFIDFYSFSNNDEIWGGWKYKSPTSEIQWDNIYAFVDFVLTARSSIFYDRYEQEFSLENLVNYYIFVNLIKAADNTGKNTYIAKYTRGEPYFYVPWDLDGTFGTTWEGFRTSPNRMILDVESGFFQRLILDNRTGGFQEKVVERWAELRSEFISKEYLIQLFENEYVYLDENGVYEREELRWPGGFLDPDQLDYTCNWIDSRLDLLDSVFSSKQSFSESKLKIDIEEVGFVVYPNPASDRLFFYNGQIDNRVKMVSFVNSVGQEIHQAEIGAREVEIDITELESGPYYLIFYFNNGEKEVRQFIVHK